MEVVEALKFLLIAVLITSGILLVTLFLFKKLGEQESRSFRGRGYRYSTTLQQLRRKRGNSLNPNKIGVKRYDKATSK